MGEAPRRQRLDAEARVTSKAGAGGRSRLETLEQRSSAKIRLPRTHGLPLEAVLVNTAGGLTGDDRVRWSASAGKDTHLRISTAACEKVYRSHGPPAVQATRLEVGPGARLDWLPQETILYDGGRLHRTLDIELAPDARLLALEAFVVGRTAMGERVRRATLRDDWRVYRGGRLLHAERLALEGDLEEMRGRPSLLGRFSAFATCLLCDPGGVARLEALAGRANAALGRQSSRTRGGGTSGPVAAFSRESLRAVRAGASALPGRVVVRIAAPDGERLRAALLPALEVLDEGRALPRVWHV